MSAFRTAALACNGEHEGSHRRQLEGDALFDAAAIKSALAHRSEGGSVRAGEARMVARAAPPYACVGGNSALCELTGLSKAELEGSTLKVLHGLDTRSSVWDMAIETAAKGTPQELRAMCNTAKKGQQLLRVHVSELQQDAGVPDDKERRLVVLILKPSTGVRTAEEAKADTSPGARVIVKNKAPFHVESVSADWQRMFGMAEVAVVGRSLKVVQGPGTDSRAVGELMNAGARGVAGQAAFMTYTLEGTRLLTYHTCSPLLSANGTIESFVAEARSTDIVDLKDALEKQTDMAMVVALDSAMQVVHASSMLCKLLKQEVGALVGQPLSGILSGANTETLLKVTTQATSSAPVLRSVLVALRNADMELMPMRVSVKPVMDAQLQISHVLHTLEPCAVVSLSEAIASQNKGREVDFIVTAKAPFVVKHVSKAWCGMYGLTEAEVTGRSLQIIHGPDTDKTALNRMIEGAMAGEPAGESLTCYRKDGSAIKASMIFYPVMSENGAIEHLRAVVDDVGRPDVGASAQVLPGGKQVAQADAKEASQVSRDEEAASKIEYPITPEGHITHINGYTQLVLYPKADPTLDNCLVYLGKLKEASIVKSWEWEGDALKVNMDTQRVLMHTQKSAWCRMWTADLRTWDAWWNRMLWVVSEATSGNDLSDAATMSREASFSDVGVQEDGASGQLQMVSPFTPALHAALTRLDLELADAGVSNSMCIVDSQGHIVFCNSAFSTIMKYSRPQLLGRSLFAMCSDEVDVVEVKRLRTCMRAGSNSAQAKPHLQGSNQAEGDLRMLTSCLELRKADGVEFWASVVGDAAPLGFRMVDLSLDDAACFCLSIEDCTDIVSPDSAQECEVLNEMNDPYTFHMAEELSLLQHEALDSWNRALADLEVPMVNGKTAPTAGLDAVSCGEPCKKAEAACKKEAGVREEKVLVQMPEDMRLQCVGELWRLKAQGTIKAWAWDCDYLSLTINATDLDSYYALGSGSSTLTGGANTAGLLSGDYGFGKMCSRASSLQRDDTSLHAIFQKACAQKQALNELGCGHDEAHGFEELHHHVGCEGKKADPGTDFAFLAAEHDGEAGNAKTDPLAANKERRREQQQQQQQQEMKKSSSEVERLRAQVAKLKLELMVEKSAKHSAHAHAIALSNELEASYVQSAVEREVSSIALQAMEASLHRQVEQVESLRMQVGELKEENSDLNGILELVRQQGEGAFVGDDDACERMSDDGFGHEVEIGEASSEEPAAVAKGGTRANGNSSVHVARGRMWMPIVSAEVVEKFRTLFTVEPVETGFALCDESGAILWCNSLFTDAVGYGGDMHVRCCRWQSFLCALSADAQATAHVDDCIKQRAALSSCLQVCRSDGRLEWMQVRMEPAFVSNGARNDEVTVLLLAMSAAAAPAASSGESATTKAVGAGTKATGDSAEAAAQVLEAAMIHGLDCIEVMSRGFPVHDALAPPASKSAAPLHSSGSAPSFVCSREAPFEILDIYNADKLYELTGYRRHEVMGKSFSIFHGVSEWQALVAAMTRLGRCGAMSCAENVPGAGGECFEATFARKDGSTFFNKVMLQAMVRPCTDGSMASVVCAVFLNSSRSQSA